MARELVEAPASRGGKRVVSVWILLPAIPRPIVGAGSITIEGALRPLRHEAAPGGLVVAAPDLGLELLDLGLECAVFRDERILRRLFFF